MEELLHEIQELKKLVEQLLQQQQTTISEPWSKEKIDSIAIRYQQIKQLRGDWVSENDIGKYIRSSWYRTGAFIREELGFINCIKDGHYYMYYKPDLITLDKALKEKNINLSRYMEFRRCEADFQKKMQKLEELKKKVGTGKKFEIPRGVKDITTSMIPAPDPQLIRDDLARLKDEYNSLKYFNYIDIYKGNHAMLKSMYYYEKYLEPKLKKTCRKWVEDFNYANNALELATKKKDKFEPLRDDLIEL